MTAGCVMGRPRTWKRFASGSDVLYDWTDYPLNQPTYYQALRDIGCRVAGVGKFDLHKATLDGSLDGSRLIKAWGFTEGIDNEGKLDGSRSFVLSGGPKGPYLAFLQERGLAEVYVREHINRKEHMDAYSTVCR